MEIIGDNTILTHVQMQQKTLTRESNLMYCTGFSKSEIFDLAYVCYLKFFKSKKNVSFFWVRGKVSWPISGF